MQADSCAKLLCNLKEEGINTTIETSDQIPREATDTENSLTKVELPTNEAISKAYEVINNYIFKDN